MFNQSLLGDANGANTRIHTGCCATDPPTTTHPNSPSARREFSQRTRKTDDLRKQLELGWAVEVRVAGGQKTCCDKSMYSSLILLLVCLFVQESIKGRGGTSSSTKNPNVVVCACCVGRGRLDCQFCGTTGFLSVGDYVIKDGIKGAVPCCVCGGSGVRKCDSCKGTGKRARWLEIRGGDDGCPVEP